MCDCISRIQESFKQKLQKENSDESITVTLLGTGFLFDKNSMSLRTYSELERSGTSGGRKKKKINVTHKFCPWCGKPYEDGSDAND